MVEIELVGITKHFGKVRAVDDVSVTIAGGELFFLLGPSGCGKTTLLRLVAGFETAGAGQVRFDGKVIDAVPANRRNTGMVFQNYALWPHLNVFRNVSYGLEVRQVGRAERRRRVLDVLSLVRLGGLEERYPSELSGGQQQRVALARALVIDPDVVLLDEPLSNLDAKLRNEMRREIRRIHDETHITMLYVTHDQIEALSLAERLAVLRDGRLEQTGTPTEVYRNPANAFVASFVGRANLLEGVAQGKNADGTIEVATAMGPVTASSDGRVSVGNRVVCAVRAESLRLRRVAQPGEPNTFEVKVLRYTYQGETVLYELTGPGETELVCVLMGDADPGLAPGDSAVVGFAPHQVSLMPN